MKRPRDELESAGRSVSRRDLLRLRVPSSRGERRADSPSDATGYDLLNVSRPAMGSYFEIRIPAQTPGGADLASKALDIIEQLESQLTIYRDDSEVAQINAEAHLQPIKVEPGLFKLLEQAVSLWSATGGAYDVTSGALSNAWGFTRGPRALPTPEVLATARARTGSQYLRLDPVEQTIAFDRPGLEINLGSIGKGYAIDRAARLIRDYWLPTPALIHGGRSSLYALGSPPDQLGGRWTVSIRNPLDPENPIGVVRLRNRGMGTSGAAFQQFEAGGRRYGHLIDPMTGEPPEHGPLSVSVLAPTAAEADALSTAFYLLGPEASASHVAEHPEVGVIFLLEGDEPDRPVVITQGLTDADILLADPPSTLSL